MFNLADSTLHPVEAAENIQISATCDHMAMPKLTPAPMNHLCDYIDAHLEDDLTLEELGRIAQYSPFHLTRLFRRATGQTLHQYVTARRLAKAQVLLTTTDLPLKHVAQQTGFSDQSHFSNHFRRAYGHSPSQERKEQQPG